VLSPHPATGRGDDLYDEVPPRPTVHDERQLTIASTTPAPRLCPAGQPYIGSTVTLPEARRRGVGRALIDAALNWTHRHGFRWISVDFEAANPMSRPFWLEAGLRPTGYGVLRLIDRASVDSTPFSVS